MIECYLLEFFFVSYFHDKIVCLIVVLSYFKISLLNENKGNIEFLLLENNSVTIGHNYLLDFISAIILSKTINTFLFFVGL